MISVWLSNAFIVIIAFLMLFITGAGCSVFVEYRRRFIDPAGKDESFNTQGWTAITITVILDVLLAAVLDVGKAYLLVSQFWGAIVGITGAVLLPILGYKSVQAVTSAKEANSVTGATQ